MTTTWSNDRFVSRWDADAAPADDDLVGGCVHASRLLGADPALVLAGGGNSSVKTVETDVHGEPVDVVWVKGSGWDMGSIEPAGFAPLRLAPVARLAELESLSDSTMANELKARRSTSPRRRRRWSRSCTPRSPTAS